MTDDLEVNNYYEQLHLTHICFILYKGTRLSLKIFTFHLPVT